MIQPVAGHNSVTAPPPLHVTAHRSLKEMNEIERQKIISHLEEISMLPGGKQAISFLLNAAGSIPVVGGAIAGASNHQGAKEQNQVNENLVAWAKLADSELSLISKKLNEILAEPTKASLALLIGEIMDEPFASHVLNKGTQKVSIVLNPATIEELQPYIKKGWIDLKNTGSVCSMGVNNSVGNQVEDKQRPYGMGNCFIMSVSDLTVQN
mgnify:CR=1 FL=1